MTDHTEIHDLTVEDIVTAADARPDRMDRATAESIADRMVRILWDVWQARSEEEDTAVWTIAQASVTDAKDDGDIFAALLSLATMEYGDAEPSGYFTDRLVSHLVDGAGFFTEEIPADDLAIGDVVVTGPTTASRATVTDLRATRDGWLKVWLAPAADRRPFETAFDLTNGETVEVLR